MYEEFIELWVEFLQKMISLLELMFPEQYTKVLDYVMVVSADSECELVSDHV